MGFKLKQSDKKITTEKDPLELELEARLSNQVIERKNIKEQVEPEFNPWDYVRVVNVMGDEAFQAKKDEKVITAHRGSSVLGNPFKMEARTLQERDRVILEHKEHLQKDLENNGPISKLLKSIAEDIVENKQKIALECYCAPANCHVDSYVPVIANMARKLLKEKLDEQLSHKDSSIVQPKKPKI
jgi:hypothetical protein